MTDEIDDFLGEVINNVRKDFWIQVETSIVPEMREFMKNEPSARKIIDTTLVIAVVQTLNEITKNTEKLLRLSKIGV